MNAPQELKNAIESNDLSAVSDAIAELPGRGSPESIKMQLLDAGAPATDTIGAGEDDLDFLTVSLLEGHSGDIACRLYDAGCPIDVPYVTLGGGSYIRLAPQHGAEQFLALCRHSHDLLQTAVSYRNERGHNMLATALAGGNRELVKLLLDAGVSPEQTNEAGLSVREFLASLDDGSTYLGLLEEVQGS